MRRDHLGHDGARQRLVDGVVERLVRRQAPVLLEVLADAVEHDDRVVQRVADDREDGRDHGEIELGLRDREHAEHQDGVVHHGEDGAQRQPPGVEAEDDVERDQHQRHGQRHDGRVAQFVADLRTHHLERGDLARRGRPWRARSWNSGRNCSAVWPVDCRPMLTSRVLPKYSTCGSWKPAAITALRTASIVDLLGEARLDRDAAGEVDGEVQAAHEERRERRDHEHDRTACTTPCAWP